MSAQGRNSRVEALDIIDRYRAVCGLCGYVGKTYKKRTPAVVAARQHEGSMRHRRAQRLAALTERER